MRLLPTLAGLVIGFTVPALAQEKNTVDPEVRQQIEALMAKQDEAFNKNDAAGCTSDYTQDAVEVVEWDTGGGAAVGREAIEKRAAAMLASNPAKLVRKLIQVYPVGPSGPPGQRDQTEPTPIKSVKAAGIPRRLPKARLLFNNNRNFC